MTLGLLVLSLLLNNFYFTHNGSHNQGIRTSSLVCILHLLLSLCSSAIVAPTGINLYS